MTADTGLAGYRGSLTDNTVTIAQVLRTARTLLEAAIAGRPIFGPRREVGLAIANADAAFERFLDESHQDHEAEALMAVRSQARRLAGAIVALSAGGRLPEELVPAAHYTSAALESMAAAAAEQRPPPPLPPFPTAPHSERLLRPVEVIHGALGRLAV